MLQQWIAAAAAAILAIVAAPVCAQQSAPFRAAAGKVDITPERPAYIAGYGQNRLSVDAHDRLMARCLVLESGRTRLAIVSCDLIGMPRYESERIRARVKSIAPDHVIIAATHTHSGPDTVGQWGPDLRTRGVDDAWMAKIRGEIATLIDATAARLEPAELRFADDPDVPGISKNIRVPRILDTELGVMQLRASKGGNCIATVANFACHPEVLNTRHITADFPHWLYETVETNLGGVCLYLNGAQGGMITADYDESTSPKGQNWAAAETLGKRLGDAVVRIARDAKPEPRTEITLQRAVFRVPLENKTFEALIKMKVFQGNTLVDGAVETEVNRFTIGPAEFLTIPGEALPNVGFYLKRHMAGEPKFLLGLTCDFLGYILTPEDFGLKLYAYESSVSVGPHMEPLMVKNLLSLEPGKAAFARPKERAE